MAEELVRPATPAVHGPLRHVPNVLTGLRLAAIPFFVALLLHADHGRSVAAGVLFGVASATDWFDGYLARRLRVQSRFGRLVDPLADRLLIGSAVLLLWYHDRVPLLVVVLVLGRDLILLSGLSLAADRGYELSVIYLGKTATFVLMGALGLMMLLPRGAVVPDVLLWVGVMLSLAAGAVYVATVIRGMKEPSSSR
jgi:CDP-diacylglycerol--glycerol-3-phosphate 3-phosphatidyltransferase